MRFYVVCSLFCKYFSPDKPLCSLCYVLKALGQHKQALPCCLRCLAAGVRERGHSQWHGLGDVGSHYSAQAAAPWPPLPSGFSAGSECSAPARGARLSTPFWAQGECLACMLRLYLVAFLLAVIAALLLEVLDFPPLLGPRVSA